MDNGAILRHQPTSLFLGPNLVLTERHDAIEFADADAASVFLARYASEPCFDILTSDARCAA